MRRALSVWERLPPSLREPRFRGDHITLVPASELASLPAWQARAQDLPAGGTLVVLPQHNAQLQDVGKRICRRFQQGGRTSRMITVR